MIDTQVNLVSYVYSKSIAEYEIPFPFIVKEFISVIGRYEDEREQELEYTDYSIVISGEVSKVVVNSPSSWDFSNLLIIRTLPIVQDTDYRNGTPMDADNVELSFDKMVMILQQLNEELSRTFKFSVFESGTSFTLPTKDERQGKVLGFDEDGSNLAVYVNPEDIYDAALAAAKSAQDNAVKIQEIADKVKIYSVTIGDGTNKEFQVDHNMGTDEVMVQVWSDDIADLGFYTFSKLDNDTLEIVFDEAPAANSVQVIVSGIGGFSSSKITWENVINVSVKPDQISDEVALTSEEISDIIGQ